MIVVGVYVYIVPKKAACNSPPIVLMFTQASTVKFLLSGLEYSVIMQGE